MSNSTDNSNLSNLSNTTLIVDTDNISTACSEWSNKVLSQDIGSVKVESIYEPLTSEDVATAYIPSLATALSKIESMILSASNQVKAAAEEQADIDNNERNKESGGNSGGNGGNNGGSNGGHNGGNNGGNSIGDTDATNEGADIDINTVVSSISELDYTSFIEFMTALGSIVSENLTDYLTKKENASKLKELILNSPHISDEFKAKIKDADPETVQTVLQKILSNHNDYVSDTSKNTINRYIKSKEYSADLTKADKYKDLLNNADTLFTEMNSVVTKDNLMENVKSIYYGQSDLSDDTTDLVRSLVDELEEEKNISYTELLGNSSNEEIVKEAMEGLSKTLAYFRTVNTLDSSVSASIISGSLG